MNPAHKYYLNHHPLGTGLYGMPAYDWYPGPLGIEHTGIEGAVCHQDIQAPHGTPFWTPKGNWSVAQNYTGDGWGLTLVLNATDYTSWIVFEHMADVAPNLTVGSIHKGGTFIGHTGGAPGVDLGVTTEYSDGPHLHVAYQFLIKEAIYTRYGKDAFVPGGVDWDYNQYLRNGGNTFRKAG